MFHTFSSDIIICASLCLVHVCTNLGTVIFLNFTLSNILDKNIAFQYAGGLFACLTLDLFFKHHY